MRSPFGDESVDAIEETESYSQFGDLAVDPYAPPEQKQAESEPVDDGFSAVQMVKNIPSSAANMVTGVAEAVTHPVETAEALGKMFGGVAQKYNRVLEGELPDELDWLAFSPLASILDATETDLVPYADVVIDAVKGRYGSVDAAIQTIEDDPVGVLADVTGALHGAGLHRTAAAVNPINAVTNTAKVSAAKLLPKGLPASMYEDVAKFSTTLTEKQRAAMVETAMLNKITPTSKGVKKIQDLVDGFNTKIDDLISAAEESGKTVPKSAIFRHIKALKKERGGVRLGASDDIEAIDKIVDNFDAHLSGLGKDKLTPKELQNIKVNAYKDINWDAKRMTGAPIKEDTFKAVAKGAKESIEELAPNVKETNAKLGELLELQPHLQRAANRIENRNMIPLDAPLQVAAGTGVGGTLGAVLGAVTSFMGLPKVKANTALRLRSLMDSGFAEFLDNNSALSSAEIMAILASREPTESDQQPTQEE